MLSGIYFGDRCSPVSTSALLVSELTGTSIFENIRRMIRSAFVPFLLTCGIYGALGLLSKHSGEPLDLWGRFSGEFTLHWLTLAPAAVILLFSVLRIPVKTTMGASILTAAVLCVFLQGIALPDLFKIAFAGFRSCDQEAGAMLNGGGVLSMLQVAVMVCLSSSYSGIFQKTGILNGAKQAVNTVSGKSTPFAAILCTSIVTGMIACNQTLTIMLTKQLCEDLEQDDGAFANDLEDTAVVVAPLIPWSIAGGVPLAAVGAPASAVFLAAYLYLLPLWRVMCSFVKKYQGQRGADKK